MEHKIFDYEITEWDFSVEDYEEYKNETRLPLKGYLYYYLEDNGVGGSIKEEPINIPIYDLIPGYDFINYLEDDSITDYDGQLDCIIINGYKTNLGLFSNNFHQGELMVNLEIFKEICGKYLVLVNWANK